MSLDSGKKADRPDVFRYTDFRRFLKDWAHYAQTRNPRWSYGLWARKMGLSSKSSLIMILNGQRSPGRSMIKKLSDSIGFSEEERRQFEKLVSIQKRTSDPMLRMMLLRSEGQVKGSSESASRWLYLIVRELVQFKSFEESATWVNSILLEPVTEEEFRSAVELLMHDEILFRDQNGRLQLSTEARPDPWSREEILRFHREGLEASARAMERMDVASRVFQTSVLRIRSDKIEQARKLIQEFQREIGRFLEETEEEPDSVYQLNLQLFPVVRKKTD